MGDFARYEVHYRRMGNTEPDWASAEASPAMHACRKPWLPNDHDARILDFDLRLGRTTPGIVVRRATVALKASS